MPAWATEDMAMAAGSPLSRRALFRSVAHKAGGAAVVAAVPYGLGAMTASAVSAGGRSQTAALSGVVESLSSGGMRVATGTTHVFDVALSSSTTLVRALGDQPRVGDRVEVVLAEGGASLLAKTVTVNGLNGTAVVASVKDGVIRTKPAAFMGSQVVRQIRAHAHSAVDSGIAVGDTIRYTAVAAHPDPYAASVLALSVEKA
jgi:hypothetical protein